ncbi:MAG: metallophosphoesterase family protein [Oscillospiraceae bacterium]|nr:metallophosphoesterase family protein [Oscillospiraceae bacterium]
MKIAPYMERMILDGGLLRQRPGEDAARFAGHANEYYDEPLTPCERFFVWQNGRLDVEEIDTPIRSLPKDLEGFRVALISDIHLSVRMQRGEETLRCTASAKPDLICMLGDFADGHTKTAEPYNPFLRAMAGIAPCAAVMGNNDYVCSYLGALREYYTQAGIPLLEDESRTIQRGKARIRVIGLQDANAFAYNIPVRRDGTMANVRTIAASDDPDMIDILLIHRPHRAARTLAQGGFAMAMAGHAHGGQWRLPGGQGLFAPGQGLLPKYTSGLYRIGGGKLLVGRGIGNHEFPIRINNRPHLPIAVLSRE